MLIFILFLYCYCFNAVRANVENKEECQVTKINTNGTLAQLVSTPNKVEEFLMRFGESFEKLVFQVEVKHKWNLSPSYRLEQSLELKKEDIFHNNGHNESSSEWHFFIVKVIEKKNLLAPNTIVLRVYVSSKVHELKTELWWRSYKVENVHILADGKVDLTSGCRPQNGGSGGPSDSESKDSSHSKSHSSYSTMILMIILGVILFLILIISILLTLMYFRKRKKRRLLQEEYESHMYESLEEIMLKKDCALLPLTHLPPPVPSPRPSAEPRVNFASSQLENHGDYRSPGGIVEERKILDCTSAPIDSERPSPSRDNTATNLLYAYDVPRRDWDVPGDQNAVPKKDDDSHYVDMAVNAESDNCN